MRTWVLGVCAALAACSDGATRVELTEQVALGQIGYAGPVLARAANDFRGDTGYGGIGAGAEVASTGGMAGSVAVAVRRDIPVGRMTLRTRAYLEHGEGRTSLPQGIGVLTDPMQVGLWADGLGAEVSLGRGLTLASGGRIDYALGLGLAHVAARVHLQSALIDRSSHVVLTLPYLLMSGRHAAPAWPAIAGEVRVYELGQAELRLGLVQEF